MAFLMAGLWAQALPITAVDQEQPRLDQAAPVPRGSASVEQHFIAAHNGLSAVELIAVVYPDAPAGPTLTLRLLDADGQTIAQQAFADLRHNAPLRLTFTPVANSAGQSFTLVLEGAADNNATAWAYSLDGYAHGSLRAAGNDQPGDLRFATVYTYLWGDIARDAALALGQLARSALALWLILFAPGLLVLGAVRFERWSDDPWARWGTALGVSLSLAPLAWQWLTVVGGHWDDRSVMAAHGVVGAAVVLRAAFRWRAFTAWKPRLTWGMIGVLTIVLISLLARLLAARDLAFPAWVDSPHHMLIARLLAESGQVPASYQPLMPVEPFTYHFGFHAVAVNFHWLTGLSLVETFLFLGQVLNGLMPLAAYAFITLLTHRPRAAWIGAFTVGWVSFFPGYYLAWGRYTQLTGLLILAPLLGLAWRLVSVNSNDEDFALRWPGVILVGVLASGLLLAHYRVIAFFATFALVALAAGRAHGWKWMALAALGTLALAAPWAWRLAEHWIAPSVAAPEQLVSPAGYNDFPWAYFQSALERGWLAIALLGAGYGLLRRERVVWLGVGWIVFTFALLNIGAGSWLVNNNAWAISLFIPSALLLGWGVDDLLARAQKSLTAPGERLAWLRRGLALVVMIAVAGLAGYASVLGLRAQVAMVNPATVQALPDDQAALAWIAEHTPAEAVFLINSWYWQSNIWAAADGGAWIWPLTGRRTTAPPVDYYFDKAWTPQVNALNERIAALTDASAPETLALLREAGVTHVFIGARGGGLKPEMFAASPHYRLLYTNGAAWVFEVLGD